MICEKEQIRVRRGVVNWERDPTWTWMLLL